MANKKTQIIYIHGGMTFKTHEDYINYLKTKEIDLQKKDRWSSKYLKTQLEDDFDIITPRMPLSDNSKYEEWKIIFERYLELTNNKIILIGESLGGIFLAKYLSENKVNKNLISVYLVCPPFDNTLTGEDLVGGFKLKENLSLILENCPNTTLMFSADDDVVPVNHAEKFKEKLPKANILIYIDKNGHFVVEEFPEIIEMIKNNI